MLPVKKIYIDSKAKTSDSKSTANFVVDLKESFTMPEDTVFTVADVLIPRAWPVVIENINNSLYVLEDRRTISHPNENLLIVRFTIQPGSYDGESLASALDKGLTSGPIADSALPFAADPFHYNVQFDPQNCVSSHFQQKKA